MDQDDIRETLIDMEIPIDLIQYVLEQKLGLEESVNLVIKCLEESSDESLQDRLKMVVVIRTDLKMTSGKIIAQTGHACKISSSRILFGGAKTDPRNSPALANKWLAQNLAPGLFLAGIRTNILISPA